MYVYSHKVLTQREKALKIRKKMLRSQFCLLYVYVPNVPLCIFNYVGFTENFLRTH